MTETVEICAICLTASFDWLYLSQCCGAAVCSDCYGLINTANTGVTSNTTNSSVTCDHCHHPVKAMAIEASLTQYYRDQIQTAIMAATQRVNQLTTNLATAEGNLELLQANVVALNHKGPLADCDSTTAEFHRNQVTAWYLSNQKNLNLVSDQIKLQLQLVHSRLKRLTGLNPINQAQSLTALMTTLLPQWSCYDQDPDLTYRGAVWYQYDHWSDWRLVTTVTNRPAYRILTSLDPIGSVALVRMGLNKGLGLAICRRPIQLGLANQPQPLTRLDIHPLEVDSNDQLVIKPSQISLDLADSGNLRTFYITNLFNNQYRVKIRNYDNPSQRLIYFFDSAGSLLKRVSLEISDQKVSSVHYYDSDSNREYAIFLFNNNFVIFDLGTCGPTAEPATITTVQPFVVALPNFGVANITNCSALINCLSLRQESSRYLSMLGSGYLWSPLVN